MTHCEMSERSKQKSKNDKLTILLELMHKCDFKVKMNVDPAEYIVKRSVYLDLIVI